MDQKQKPRGLAPPEVGGQSVVWDADHRRIKPGAPKKQECEHDFEALARKAEPPDPPESVAGFASGEDADEPTGEPDCILKIADRAAPLTPEPQSYERPSAPRAGGLYKINILVTSVEGYPCGQLPILTGRAGLGAIVRAAKAHGVARNTRGRVNA